MRDEAPPTSDTPPTGDDSRSTHAFDTPSAGHGGGAELIAGRYRLLAELGAGGQGRVYRAFDEALHRVIAIKIYHLQRGGDPRDAEKAYEEARRLSDLRHPHIVRLLDAGPCVWEGQPAAYVTTEEIVGAARLDVYCQSAKPSLAWLCRALARVAEALAAVHTRGLVHRDVKPANLLIGDDRAPRLVDLGIADLARRASGPHNTGVGTPAYMAPEQRLGGSGEVGPRTDLYGLGISARAVLPLVRDPDTAPPALARLLDRLTADDPARRPASAIDVALELQNIADELDPAGASAAPGFRLGRRAMLAVCSLLSVVLVWLAHPVARSVDQSLDLSDTLWQVTIDRVPRAAPDDALRDVICLVLSDSDDVEALATSLGLPGVRAGVIPSYRALHAAAFRSLARADVSAVAVDIIFPSDRASDDPALRQAMLSLGAPVVLAADGYPRLGTTPALAAAFRDFPVGGVEVFTSPGRWEVDVALQTPDTPPALALSLRTVALGRQHRVARGTDHSTPAPATRPDTPLDPLAGKTVILAPERSAKFVSVGDQAYAMSEVGPARPKVIGAINGPALAATIRLRVPTQAEVSRATLTYSEFFALSDQELTRRLNGKFVLLVNARQEGRASERRVDVGHGRSEFAFYAHAAAMSSLANRRPPRPPPPVFLPAGMLAVDSQLLAQMITAVSVAACLVLARTRVTTLIAITCTLLSVILLTLTAWHLTGVLFSLPMLLASGVIGSAAALGAVRFVNNRGRRLRNSFVAPV